MVDTPRPAPPPQPSVTKTVTATKEVTLPHMPSRPQGELEPSTGVILPENTVAEQEAGRAAVETNDDRLNAEQEAGRAAIARFNKR
jgi:hypothetical protein